MTARTADEPSDTAAFPESSSSFSSAEVVRRRAIPALYVVDRDLRIHFSCGVSRNPGTDRLPARVERIVRTLMQASREGSDRSAGVDGELVVRLVESYSRRGDLTGVVVETLRTRDPLREAVQRFGLTTREMQVLRLLLVGSSSAAIARQLHIAETTASEHVRRIADKTASRGRGQIVARVLGFR